MKTFRQTKGAAVFQWWENFVKPFSRDWTILPIIFLVLLVGSAQAELLLGFDVNGLAGTQATTTNTVAATNISTDAPNARITRGAGLVAASASSSMSASSWTLPGGATIASAITSNDYFTVRVVPEPGYTIDITNFSWRTIRSGTGPTNYHLRAGHDGFGSDLATWLNKGTAASNFVATINILNSTGVEFRIYGYDTHNNGGTARIADGANFGSTGIDLAIFGTVNGASGPPSVSTSPGTATNTTTATTGGDVTADGGAAVTNRGVVYRTTTGVTISDNKTPSGSGTGSFTANLSSLSVNTKYYFKAYAQNDNGTTLGSEMEFWTWANSPSAPTVNNSTASSLDVNVNPNGNPSSTIFSIQATNNSLYVQTNGTLGATEHWRTDAEWATTTVTGLDPATTYGFRVRAQNGAVVLTAWSSVGNGTTLADVPTVTTTAANPTNQTTATAGGNVTSDGGAAVTNRGVVWALSPAAPTVSGAQTTNGAGTGVFSSVLTNLAPGATYNFRAFAQNSAGTAYGDTQELTTPCWSGVVTGLTVTATNSTSFSLAWSNVPFASGYFLDVSTSATFSALGVGDIYTNTFEGASKGAYASGTVVIAGITWWMDEALIGTATDDRKNGARSARLRETGAIGMQNATNMGLSSITFLHGTYGSDGDSDGRVEYTTDGWTTWSTAGTFTASSTTLTPFEATNLNVSGSVAVRIVKTSGGSARMNVDDIHLFPNAIAPDFVGSYANLPVSGTDQLVSGLDEGVTYFYRVRAGDTYCTSANSATGSVTTLAGTDITPPDSSTLRVNGEVSLLDDELPGGVELTVVLTDGDSGLAVSPPPSFILYFPDGTSLTGQFSAAYSAGITTPVTVTNVTDIQPAQWMPGVFTAVVVAVDMEGNVGTNASLSFTLMDDDNDAPVVYEHTIDGLGMSGDGRLPAGGIAIIGVNGHPLTGDGGGDGESFAFVVLSPFPEGTELFFTDAGWSNNAAIGWHRTSEFHRASWVSTGSEALGSVVTLIISNINNGGDQVAVYQYDGVSDPKTDPDNVRFLYAITIRNNWFNPPVPDNNESSALYFGLTNGFTAVSLPSATSVNVRYTGTRTGTAKDLLVAISNPGNWTVDPTAVDIAGYGDNFVVLGPGDLPWDNPVLTDAQILSGGYTVTGVVQDITSGLLATGTTWGPPPHFFLVSTNGEVVVSNQFEVSFSSGITTEQIITLDNATGVYERIVLGNYFSHIVISDTDNDRLGDNRVTTNVITVAVIDDDADPPEVGGDPLRIMIGSDSLASTGSVEVLAAWNFNNASARTVVSHGAGAMNNNIATTNSNTGTSINAYPSDPDGNDLTVQAAGNIGRYIQFDLDLSGRKDLVASFAARRSSAGYNSNVVAFAVNGGAFTTIDAAWSPTLDAWTFASFDLSAYPEINGAALVSFRITFGTNSVTGGGNNRFDNFRFEADYLTYFEITDAQLAAVDGANPLRFSFNAFDAFSGLALGTAFDGTNSHVTIDGIATNNTAAFQAALSSADSTLSTATSVWQFTSFTYNLIGALFADGQSNRPIRASFADADNDRPGDTAWASNLTFGLFRVIDDDVTPPEVANISVPNANARPFLVLTNGGANSASETIRNSISRRSGTGSNTVFRLTDADLANAGTIGLQFAFGARDLHSGVARGNVGNTNTVMSFSVGNIIVGNYSDYNSTLSSAQTATNQLLTNVWSFGNFSGSLINALMAVTGSPVRVTIPDTDNDRPNDQALLISQHVGYLSVVDDDLRGPIISAVAVEGAFGSEQGSLETFEPAAGWTNNLSFSGGWTFIASNGTYIAGGNVLWGSLDPKVSGTRRIGLLTNVAQDISWLQLPPIADPGTLTLFAGRFGAEGAANDVTIRVERADGPAWVNLGDRAVTNLNPEFEAFTWGVNVDGVVTLRLTRVTTTGPQVYVDDISITPIAEWISTNQLNIAWSEAVDDFSGVDEYRIVVPSAGTSVPSTTNAGVRRAFGITNDQFSIVGHQGVITGYVFAIDDDNDRPNDRAIGNIKSIVVRVDTNPPPAVAGLRATDAAGGDIFDSGIDESLEIKVEWSAFAGEAQAAGWRQSDSAPLSPWDSYIIQYHEVTDTNGIPIANAVTTTMTRAHAAWSNVLNNWAFTNLVVSNLNFDSYYAISIRGRDVAGNVGPAATVIGNTDRFVLTQAVARADRDVELFWTGPADDAMLRDYDLIYVDSPNGFRNSLSNQWELLKYTNRPNAFDLGDDDRPAPSTLTNGVYRFYRVAKSDRWQTNQAMRSASVEVYVSKALSLFPGENWHSLFFEPDTPTVSFVFGTNRLPSGASADQATKITWFDGSSGGSAGQGGQVKESVWLGSSGNWYHDGGFTLANDLTVPLNEAFLIELPMTANSTSLVMVGRVPTQELVRTISGSGASLTNPQYVIASQLMPERLPLSVLASQWAGFQPGANISRSDEIRILTPGGSGSLQQPKARIWRRQSDNAWLHHTGASAANYIIEPEDAVIFVRRHDTPIVWTNRPAMYQPPTKNFTP